MKVKQTVSFINEFNLLTLVVTSKENNCREAGNSIVNVIEELRS